jgi:small ligand-binding sensory domain FIST
MTSAMGARQFASASSTLSDAKEAVSQACRTVREALGSPPELAVLFLSHHHRQAEGIPELVAQLLGPKNLIGCTGESIVADDREIEGSPAVSLWGAKLPGVSIEPMHLDFEPTSEGLTFHGFPETLTDGWPEGSVLLLLGDPYSFPTPDLLARINEDHPGTVVVGGMSSGGMGAGDNRLFLDQKSFRRGAVAVLIHGPVAVRTVVSQGCRPIGKPFVVTKAQDNLIEELGGRPALVQLQEVFAELPTRDQQLVQQGLHVGRVINEYQDSFSRGDFLVRNVIGADATRGFIAVGDYVRRGQTIQFHVRDAESADEDLRLLLGQYEQAPPQAALLFTCNGRGSRLFSEPDHDARSVRKILGEAPTAGFFAQGEIGPVGGKSFLHGFTASVVLFGDASGARSTS